MSTSFCKESIWDGWIGCGSHLWKSRCATECRALRAVSGSCECSVRVSYHLLDFKPTDSQNGTANHFLSQPCFFSKFGEVACGFNDAAICV